MNLEALNVEDRKRLKKLQEKRMALGHKPDDHEEQWPDMTM